MAAGKRLAPLGGLGKWHWIGLAAVCVAAWALFVHFDVLETADHTYVFLDSLFTGRFLDFYEVVVQRPTTLYYLNYANYNIVVYLLYGLFQLPYYVVLKITGGAPDSFVLVYFAKLVALVFHFGSVWLVGRIGLQLGFAEKKAALAALAYGLAVPAFFSAPVMGQYDSVCIFFILLSVLYLMRGRMWAFVLVAGFGMAFKFFCAFIFIPLLLLYEKRLLRILLYGVCSLWLIAPTTLLFHGRTGGGQDTFLQLMVGRLLEVQAPAGYALSAFGLCFFALCVLCWLWRPAAPARAALWVGLAVFSLLFLFVAWHPQWVALLCPFMVLTALQEKNGNLWLLADAGFSLGYLGISCMAFAGHFGDNLLDQGFVGVASGVSTRSYENAWTISGQLAKIPMLYPLCTVLFFGTLLLGLALKFPLKKGSLYDKLAGGALPESKATPAKYWAVFGVCMGGWLALVLLLWVRRAMAL